MKLLNPVMIRMKPEHEAWLKAEAEREGHGNKSLTLRLLVERAMQTTRKKRTAA